MKIVKITSTWCPSCIIMNNVFNKINKKYPDLEVITYDYDFDEEMVSKYNVGEILPVLIFMEDDKEIGRLIGEKSFDEVEKFLK
ncbi:MAG: thioredoxin family protein [Bacilli bacterium]|nr:thioredoxin family protein [Bacilli bacterium]